MYLFCPPEQIVADAVRPLCYENGRLLRPAVPPAVVMPDRHAGCTQDESCAYRVMASLWNNGCMAIAAYNLGRDEPVTESGKVRPGDYGKDRDDVAVPRRVGIAADGLVVYDWYAGRGKNWKVNMRLN